MVIQRRVPDGTVNFTRNWSDYENGFGDLEGEFWYGLRNIHHLTTRDDVELRIDMVREDDGTEFSWTYQTFRVADAMAYSNNSQFTTYDRDNDNVPLGNCAFVYQGGWWHDDCALANLNGPHTLPSTRGVSSNAQLVWNDGTSYQYPSSVEMKIREKQCLSETCITKTEFSVGL